MAGSVRVLSSRKTSSEVRGAGEGSDGPGAATVAGGFGTFDDGAFGLRVSSSLDLSVLGLLDPELELDGEGHIDLTIEGPRIDPDIEGAIRLSDSAGRYKDVTWSELALSARADDDRLDSVGQRIVDQ